MQWWQVVGGGRRGVRGVSMASVICAAACWLAFAGLPQARAAAAADGASVAAFGATFASAAVRRLARQVLDERDAAGRSFAIVDKAEARLYVFRPNGQLLGATAALLGLARGDASMPLRGWRTVADIPPQWRTTPAGRFDSEPGHNDKGEAVVWVDYAAAIAIHRLRPARLEERRAERLASATPDDNRISLGCIVVSEAFYDDVVAPALGSQRGVVYVLPEAPDAAQALVKLRRSEH